MDIDIWEVFVLSEAGEEPSRSGGLLRSIPRSGVLGDTALMTPVYLPWKSPRVRPAQSVIELARDQQWDAR